MKQPVLYKITNVVNGKFYVGSTGNARERFRQHRNKLRRGVHHCAHLQAAWNKYGEDCFKFSIIEHIESMEALVEAENKWLIDHVGKENCYNAGTRADAPMRGRSGVAHPNFGKPQTSEQKAQISATLKEFYAADYFNHPRVGKTHSEETKAKISASKKANPVAYWQGKKRSEETKAKISEAQKGVAKPGRKYTEAGLAKIREVMRQNGRQQKPADFDAVKAKFHPDVLAKYDFSNAVYLGALVRIEGCMCPTHGVFSQYAAQFRKGRGCPACGAEQRAESKRAQMKQVWATEEGRKVFMENRKPVDPTPAT